jgi:Terpene synthase family 2, C-terminal metal binding
MAPRHPNALRKATRSFGTEIPSRKQLLASIVCPFPLLVNPHRQAAEASSLTWLMKHGLAPTLKHRARVSKAHLSTLVAGFYPTAALAQLKLASDYVCWAFALDDVGDETDVGERPGRLLDLFEGLEWVLQGRTPSSAANALDRGLSDVLQRVSKFTSDAQLAEFVEGNRAYFGGMLWEANNRAHAQVPDETAYLTFRPAAGAVPSFFSLIEPLEQIALSPAVRAHRAVQHLARLAGSIICWINDVLSYEKERAHGDFHNLVMVYEHHRRIPPSVAAPQAIARINSAIAEFSSVAESVPSFGATDDRELRRYVDTLRAVIRITLAWTYDSTRYHDGQWA